MQVRADTSEQLVALVTGCTDGGIGSAICLELLAQGCKVYASARRVEAMADLSNSGAMTVALDVLSKESCQAAVETIVNTEGRIDILINNAGVGGTGPLLEVDLEQSSQVFLVNTLAPLRLAQLVAPFMIKKRSGLIVNIGSVVGEIPTPWGGIYSASKAALHSLTRTLEMELSGFGIEVMLCAPGGVKSKFGENQLRSYKVMDDSAYRNLSDAITGRAMAGQVGATPARAFARQLVVQIAKRPGRRTSYFSAAARSWTFAILRWLPWPITRFLLMRNGRCQLVGK